ncbi:MAG: hypothetical protein R3174_13170 [Gammaproteobacteria bacterium]|nr:hypothetical protein [Gammaproteobacteria bacterium]
MTSLRGVGYWIEQPGENHGDPLPDPARLLRSCGPRTHDPRVIAYLRSGREFRVMLGFSYCRFGCGIADDEMGCRDLTDGEWVWPEGFAHYIEVHGLPLPDEFLATMNANRWQVPEVDESIDPFETGYGLAFWTAWCGEQMGR